MKMKEVSLGSRKIFEIKEPFNPGDFSDSFYYERNRKVEEKRSDHYLTRGDASFEIFIPFNFAIPAEIIPHLNAIRIGDSYRLERPEATWHTESLVLYIASATSAFELKMNGVRTIEGQFKKLNKVIDRYLEEELPSHISPKDIAIEILNGMNRYNKTVELAQISEEYELYLQEQTQTKQIIEQQSIEIERLESQITALKAEISRKQGIIYREKTALLKNFFDITTTPYSCIPALKDPDGMRPPSYDPTPARIIENFYSLNRHNLFKTFVKELEGGK